MEREQSVKISVDLSDRNAHLFNITMHVSNSKQNQFSLPAWTPGSYMIREFAQHIVSIKAFAESSLLVKKVNKNTFEIVNAPENFTINYQVYAFDSSIRAAFIDDTQAFFNGTALFLRPLADASFLLEILRPHTAGKQWQVATGLNKIEIDEAGFGTYFAQSYDELVDHPFQMSPMKKIEFMAQGIAHEMALVGDVREFDEQRLATDLAKLCETTLSLFAETPFQKYIFIARFEEGAYGGLEHRNSSMLLSSPLSLPKFNMGDPDAHYRNFLGLCAHEYFHAWNIKTLKPRVFYPYDYDHENYTTMLWVFEGITAYYDDLLIKRAELISLNNYLELMAKNYSRLLKVPGRLVQSVADASFDTWIKFYRPNENSPNTQVSYYIKGSYIALYIDLLIRIKTGHQQSLDDVMRMALANFPKGITEEEFLGIIKEVGGLDVDELKNDYIYGTKDLPLASLLKDFGLDLTFLPDEMWLDEKSKLSAFLGFKLRFEGAAAFISTVERFGPAELFGLSPHDELLAVNGVRLDSNNSIDLLASLRKGEPAKLLLARKKVLCERVIVPAALPETLVRLTKANDISSEQQKNLEHWIL